MPSRPNVLVIFTDDQRFDTLAALGQQAIRTPHLDRLAARGTAFTCAHIPGGTSGAVCMPSRAMLHTGRTLFHLQGAGETIPSDHVLLGETLRAAGYHTYGIGKWHNGPETYHRSFADGDEIFFGGMADHWNVPAYHYRPDGRYAPTPRCPDAFRSNETRLQMADHIHCGRHSTDLLGETAARFLRGYHGAAPFFLYLAFLAPHDPRTMPPEYLAQYDPDRLQLPPNCYPEHPFDNGALRVRDELLAPFPRTPENTRRHLAEYYAMITHLDRQVGCLLDTLAATGRLDSTYIVLAGDNGLALGQHGLFGKQSLYDHSVRVPLLISGPGLPAGQRCATPVYLLDIYPTLCELLGLPIPASVDGHSLVPQLRHPATPARDQLYLAYIDSQRGLRRGQHKLIEYVVGGRHTMTQLFDLAADPWETRNLAAEPAHAALLASLRQALRQERDRWHDRETAWGRTFWAALPD